MRNFFDFKKITSLSLVAFLLFVPNEGSALNKKKSKPATVTKKNVEAPRKKVQTQKKASSAANQQLSQALSMAKAGQYQAAATSLFNLARRPELADDRAQIKYILGLMLMEMKMNQVAAFQFVDVIRTDNPKYTRQAIEKLSLVADNLGDDTLLNYAISKIDLNDVPASSRDMIFFRIGEIKLKNKNYSEAISSFAKVQRGSSNYNQAVFNKGLAQLEQGQSNQALQTFQNLLSLRSKAGVTDTNKVAAQMAIARTLYQAQDWEAAIQAYSLVPRDHFLWHDALFEQSWAMLRAARFRSVLSNFQSLHSSYYEDFYIPESLLLRAIVYLYICKYDEMEKVLGLFEKTYNPVRLKISSTLSNYGDAMSLYGEIEKATQIKKGEELNLVTRLPYMVLKSISDEGNVRRSLSYIRRLNDEKAKIEESQNLKSSNFGSYGIKVINTRLRNTKIAIGEMVRAHLQNMQLELRDLYEQSSLIRYEMINGQKESLRKKMAGKTLVSVDEEIDRDFYVQNGYEYYPFTGEYWLDEIGNYHYLGKQSCE